MSCATYPDTSPELLPTIDRTPTLPKELSIWKPFVSASLDSERQFEVYPFRWEQGLTDRLTLVWMPLPLQFRYLIHQGNQFWIATDFALLGQVQSRLKDFDWWPSFSISSQLKLSQVMAAQFEIFVQPEFKRGRDHNSSQSSELKSGVLLQVNDRIALNTTLSALYESGEVRARYPGEVPMDQGKKIRYPISVKAFYSFNRNWELELDYKIYSVGYEKSFISTPIFFVLTHRW